MSYAFGKHAWSVCDRCGFRTRYTERKLEWTGLYVCCDCYEDKHPQLDLKGKPADAEALYKPRPDVTEESVPEFDA